jgi:hypothetical protein
MDSSSSSEAHSKYPKCLSIFAEQELISTITKQLSSQWLSDINSKNAVVLALLFLSIRTIIHSPKRLNICQNIQLLKNKIIFPLKGVIIRFPEVSLALIK